MSRTVQVADHQKAIGLPHAGVQTAANAGVPEDQAGLAAALITASFQLGSAPGLAVFSGIATSRTSHLLAAHAPPPEAPTVGFQRTRGCPQNTELCVINDPTGSDAKACRSALRASAIGLSITLRDRFGRTQTHQPQPVTARMGT